MRFILAGLYLRSQTRGLAALRENTGIADTFGSVLTPIRAAVTRNNMAVRVGARLGPYDIISVLGAGGFGEVYKARDTRLDRTVAIKIL
jgi:serine/threonine protein kinase